MYPIHKRNELSKSFERLDLLWEKYPQFREMSTFTSLDALLEEHCSYQEGFDELKDEYIDHQYEKFLIQLSWSDLAYRYATRKIIESQAPFPKNDYVEAFMDQFKDLDTDHKAYFLFPESYVSQFFVIMEVCKKAESVYPIKNLFSDETKIHYLAVFDKENMEDILLMYHLLYTNASQEVFGGYSLYDYSLPWYQSHLWQDGVVLRSPYLPDYIAKFQGNLPFHHNPSKTVYVRRNIEHMIDSGYFKSELELFLCLTKEIMPLFQWWYEDLFLYEKKDGMKCDWRLKRTQIRTQLTSDGIIKPKWKSELSLFRIVHKAYPDTLYQYRPEWLSSQSLDIYIPSLHIAIEYQGIQHYQSIDFFGGEEALIQRQILDDKKRELCKENNVILIEWPYSLEPTKTNLKTILQGNSFENKE